jgi:indole-3-glycerol phosphate synthase
MSILDEIFSHKREEVAARKRDCPLEEIRRRAEMASPARDFTAALRLRASAWPGARPLVGTWPKLIAEIKRASPSRGRLVEQVDPLRLARVYRENGAAAISILTDEKYFQGSLADLRQVACLEGRPPLLRKDFVCDPYQVYEAREAGADAVLLIAAHLDCALLADLHALAAGLGMAALVEVHSREEVDRALEAGPSLLGINNRDLRNFSVRLETTLELRRHVPPEICLVAESGIHTVGDVQRLAQAGVDAILVGEALVTAADPAARVFELAHPPAG